MKSLQAVTGSSDKYVPGQTIADIKARFAKLNAFIMARGGFVVSVPGAPEVVFEVLPESTLPYELLAAGYDLRPADPPTGERMLAAAITQKLTLSSCGIFEEMTEGGTKPVAQVPTHAGILRVTRYATFI
jgi:hypothetical protein